DFTIGGSASGFRVSQVTGTGAGPYTVTLTSDSTTSGTVALSLKANAVTDVTGRSGPSAGTAFRAAPVVDYDRTPPAVATMTRVSAGTTLVYDVTFTEPVTGLSSSDFSNAGTSTGWTAVLNSGSGAGPYRVTYSTATAGAGTVIPAAAADAVADLGGTIGPIARATGPSTVVGPPAPSSAGCSGVACGAPAVTGRFVQGAALSRTNGTWSATPSVLAYTYQWQYSTDDITWANIAGATGASYTVTTADLARHVRVAVTARNAVGSTVEYSRPVIPRAFPFTGAPETWTVPAGASAVQFDIRGAAGGLSASWSGGQGGVVYGALQTTPGDDLVVTVGGVGGSGALSGTGAASGGFNGGGTGGASSISGRGGAGGGGATDIRAGGSDLADRVVVAGGGGGAGYGPGGVGGPATGGNGSASYSYGRAGLGGTQSAGGGTTATAAYGATSGALGLGGDGGGGGSRYGGGAGGGGYYGGGGGDSQSGYSYLAGGGGGSSYPPASGGMVTTVSLASGGGGGEGSAVLWYDRPAGIVDFAPTRAATNGSSIDFRISFTNAPSGLAANDFAVTGTASGWSVASVSGSGTGPYTITVTGAPAGTGRVGLKLRTGSVAIAGSAYPTSATSADAEVVVERRPPQVTSFTRTASAAASVTYALSFDEAVTGLAAADITNAGTSTGWSTQSVSGSGSGPYEVVMAAAGATTGTLVPQLAAAAVNDAAGNAGASAARSGTASQVTPPRPRALPVATGDVISGQALAATSGTWGGVLPPSAEAYLWQVSGDGAAWANATGVGSSTSSYIVDPADAGSRARVRVIATNGVGSATAYSASIATPSISPEGLVDFEPTTSSPTRGSSVAFRATFSTAPTGLQASDFSVTGTASGWSVTGLSGSGAGPYTITVGAGAGATDGTVDLDLTQGAVTLGGVAYPDAPMAPASDVLVDRTRPTGSWTPPETPTNAATLTYQLSFSEPVLGLAASDFSNAGTATGCEFAPAASSGMAVNVVVTGCSEGTVVARLAADAIADAAGNAGPATVLDADAVLIDRTRPTVTAFTASTPTRASTITYSLSFSEPVLGLEPADFSISGTASGWSVVSVTATSGTTYSVLVSRAAGVDGTVIVTLDADAVSDAAGNGAPASAADGTTVTVDATPPSVAGFTAPSITHATSITYALTFSESVTGLSAGDFAIGGDSEGWTVTAVSGSGAGPYSVTIAADAPGDGDVVLSLGARTVVDPAGNLGPVTAQAASTVTVDRSRPTVASFSTTSPSPTGAEESTYTLKVDGDGTDLAAEDMNVGGTSTGWSVTSVTALSASEYEVLVGSVSPTDGTVVVTLAADAVEDAAGNRGPPEAVSTSAITRDGSNPGVASFTLDTATPTRTGTLDYTLRFSEAVTGLGAEQLTIGGTSTGWSVDSVEKRSATEFGITLTAGAPGQGTVTLDVNADAVADGVGNRGPAAGVAAPAATFDSVAPSSAPTITSRPAASTQVQRPEIAFSGAAAGDAYLCALDGGAEAVCTSPYTVPAGLSPGDHSLVIRLRDAAGNTSSATATVAWSYDVTPPAAPIVSAPRTPTNNVTASIAFTAEDGATTACRVDAGAWTACTSPFTTASLADGTHTLAVRATDAAGNTGTSASVSWVVDTVAPTEVPTFVFVPSGAVSTATATFALSTASGLTTQCSLDSGDFADCATPVTFRDLADGVHALAIRYRDAAGNPGGSVSTSWTVDTTPPANATITSGPADGSSDGDSTPAFGFSGAGAGEGYSCRIDGGPWATCTSGSPVAALLDGEHTLEVAVHDAAGNLSPAPASRTWVVDTVGPALAPGLAREPSGSPVSSTDATVQLSGAAEGESYECSIDGDAWAACTTPVEITGLDDGGHSVRARRVDAAGNPGPVGETTWVVDTAPPTTPPALSGAPSGATAATTASITIAVDDGNTIECRLDGADWAACTSPWTTSGLADGAHAFAARQVDPAGNAGPQASAVWWVDTAPPAAPTPGAGPDDSREPVAVFTFTGEPDSTFRCRLSTRSPDAVISDWTACASPHQTPSLEDGAYRMEIVQVDPAGNAGDAYVYDWVVRTGAPAQVTVSGIPDSPTNATTATLTATGEDGATIRCVVDGGGVDDPCDNPLALTGLGEGNHVVIYDQQLDGVTSAATVIRWTVDTTPPTRSPGIVSRPASPTSETDAEIVFRTAPNTTTECALDGGAYAACSSPRTLTGLAEGSHTLDIRSVDRAGNAGAASTVTWIVDRTPPTAPAEIGSRPDAITASTSALLTFTAGSDGVSTQCSVDGAAFAACTSPVSLTDLAEGSHSFSVRPVDGAGNIRTAATSYTWVVDLGPPTTTPSIDSGPSGTTSDAQASLAFSGASAGEAYQCSLDGGTYAACTSPYTSRPLADGSHVFRARLVDGAGNVGPAVTREWSIDTVAPSAPTFTSRPTGTVASTSATVAFSGLAAGDTAECNVDSTGFVSCTSPRALSDLADGAHEVVVRFRDGAGNTGPTATAAWTVDTTPPSGVPAISSAPEATTSATTASIAFSGAKSGETYRCSIDGAAFAACTSPKPVTGLSEGAHTFRVHLVDAVGNAGEDAAASWTVDRTAPAAPVITDAPATLARSAEARVEFTVAAGDSAQCRADGGAWDACSSPWTATDLADGAHSLAVRALDAAGNAGPSVTASWTVDTGPPPAPTITAAPSARITTDSTSVAFSGTESGATFTCRLDSGAWGACTSPVALADLVEGAHRFEVRAVDAAGNEGPVTAADWTVDTLAPATAPTISGTPVSPTREASASLVITATEAGTTLECSVDGAAWAACTSPLDLSGLADGAHSARARMVDLAGNAGPAATATWSVDTVGPVAAPQVTGVPSGLTSATSFTASITGSAGTTFECSNTNGASWITCSSGYQRTGLRDGQYTFLVRQLDAAGNPSPEFQALFTVDAEPPVAPPSVGAVPPASAETTATFTFTGDPDVTFECRVDAGAWATCTSPYTTAVLAEGIHSFATRQVDRAGNTGPVDTTTWAIDTTAPDEVGVSGIPSSPTTATTASMTLTTESGSTLACLIDDATDAELCPASPPDPLPAAGEPVPYALDLTGLGNGDHQVVVWQVDAAGNQSTRRAIRWTIDLTPPAYPPAVTSRPARYTASRSAQIAFTGEPGTAAQCSVDGAAFASCTSPLSLTGLADGNHTFRARSADALGNVSTASDALTWTVDTVPPAVAPTIISGPSGTTGSSVATFTFDFGDGVSADCSLDGAAYAACTSPTTLTGLAEGQHTFRVRAVDAAGNVGATPASWDWDVFSPQTPPPGTPGIQVVDGAGWLIARAVVLDVIWPSGTRYVELANTADFSDAVRSTVSTQLGWTVAAGASGDRTIHARFLDQSAAEISRTSVGLQVDLQAPVVASVAVEREGGGRVTLTPALSDDASGVASWQATADRGAPGPRLPADQASQGLSATDGSTVYVRAIDVAGNVSAWTSVEVPADPAAPPASPAPPAAPSPAAPTGGSATADPAAP
ncbi:MAG: Ig-like domain-containing protein, partial [Miltoncostaeaceae bacterium]